MKAAEETAPLALVAAMAWVGADFAGWVAGWAAAGWAAACTARMERGY